MADRMFSIRVVSDSEKVNSQTSRGKPGIPARKYKSNQNPVKKIEIVKKIQKKSPEYQLEFTKMNRTAKI